MSSFNGISRRAQPSERRRREVLSVVASGRSIQEAAEAAGVQMGTIHKWKIRHPRFRQDLESAYMAGRNGLLDIAPSSRRRDWPEPQDDWRESEPVEWSVLALAISKATDAALAGDVDEMDAVIEPFLSSPGESSDFMCHLLIRHADLIRGMSQLFMDTTISPEELHTDLKKRWEKEVDVEPSD
jgi:transposase-like protein